MVLLSLLQVFASLAGLFWGGWVFLTRSLFDEVQGRDTLVQVCRSLSCCLLISSQVVSQALLTHAY